MKNEPKVILWDIETTNLSANYGYILCVGWKELGRKGVQVKSISDYPLFKKDPTNDRELIKDVREVLASADLWVYHYGCKFDLPYFNSRLLAHNLQPLPRIKAVDTWRVAKYNMKLNSNRLDTLTHFLSTSKKTPIDGNQWVKAMAGDPKAIKYVVVHCKADVAALEDVYNKIKCVYPGHPNLNIVRNKKDGCPVCGNGNLIKRGMTYNQTTMKQRYQCTSCGSWSHGKITRLDVPVRND